jgi:hypothetical protein
MTSWQERMAWILTHRLAWQNGDRVYHAWAFERTVHYAEKRPR